MSWTKTSCIYSPKYTTFHSLVGNILYIVVIALILIWNLGSSRVLMKAAWDANLAALDLTVLLIPSWFAFSHPSHPPLLWNRHYFALPTNPGEQFYMFCTLAAWLINKTGRPFEQPQEYDDPNATISNILSELRAFVSILKVWISILASVTDVSHLDDSSGIANRQIIVDWYMVLF